MNKPILQTKGLSHVYSQDTPFQKTAVNDINIDIFSGEYIGIIGHTGSGKSTLIQHLNALLKPSSGQILYNDQDIWEKKYNRSLLRFNVGLVFQYPEYQLFEETVEKDIAYGPKNMGLSADEISERVHLALKFVGLDENILQSSPFELSGGQKRRVAIAGIMAMQPKILIFDEPTAGLDPRGRDEILSRISNYRDSEKCTVLLVSHSMEDIASHTEKVLVMDKGSVWMFAPTAEIFEHSSELLNMGLDVPQITKVFLSLKNKGHNVKSSVFTTKQACDEIMSILGEKND